MLKRNLLFLLLICSAKLLSQNICEIRNDYNASQNWIKTIQKFDKIKRKDSILKLIECYSNEIVEPKFFLNIVLDGHLMYEGLKKNRNNILEKIDSNNFEILNSLCEGNFYPQRCNLGFVLIKTDDGIIHNDLKFIKSIKRKKDKLIIISKNNSEIELETELFDKGIDSKKRKIKILRGKNKIDLKKTNSILLVKITDKNNQKLILTI